MSSGAKQDTSLGRGAPARTGAPVARARAPSLDCAGECQRAPPRRAASAVLHPASLERARIQQSRRVAFALASNQILASATHLVAKGAVGAVGALPVALLRFVIATVTLVGWRLLRRGRAIERRDWPRFLLLGLLAVPLNQGFFLFGMVRTTPTHASLLYALTPLVVFVLARLLIRERTPWSALVGIGAAFAGVLVILAERGLKREMEVLGGDLLILVAVFAWALYTVLSKPLLARYDAMTVTTWSIATGTILALPAVLVPGAVPAMASIRPPVWAAIAYLAIGTSAIAYPLYMYALRHLDAAKVAVTQNTQPVLTAILSWFLFHERFSGGFLLGAGLILAGVLWVETRRTSIAPEPEPAGEAAP